MKNKRYEVMLSVLTIMTVLTTVLGVSFSYFTNSISGTPSEVVATTDVIGGVSFDGGADFTTSTDIEPGWSESKTFTITVAPSNHTQIVTVKMKYVNGFRDLTASVNYGSVANTDFSNGAKGVLTLEKESSNQEEVILVEKSVAASDTPQTFTYTLTMSFPDTDENQNYDQGKTFEGTLFADLGGTSGMYYNAQNPNGTNTKPSAQ